MWRLDVKFDKPLWRRVNARNVSSLKSGYFTQRQGVLLSLDPENEVHQQSKIYYESRLKRMQDGQHYHEEDEEEISSEENTKPELKQDFMLHYEKLCRGEANKVNHSSVNSVLA